MSSSNASGYFWLNFPCNTCVPYISVTDLCLKRMNPLCRIYNVCHHMCQHSISFVMVRTCEETDGDILLLLTASPTVVAKQEGKMGSTHLLLSLFFSSLSALTTSDLSTIRTKLERKVIRGSNVPTAVRLAFHDCVGRTSNPYVIYLVIFFSDRRLQRLFELRQPVQFWP